MRVVIDFDGVLFDDRRFKEAHRAIFKAYGIGEDSYAASYEAAKAARGGVYFLTNSCDSCRNASGFLAPGCEETFWR